MTDRIIYKPVCGNCGEIINEEVYGIHYTNLVSNDKYTMEYCGGIGVFPPRCDKCGAWFDGIIKDTSEIKVRSVLT